MKLTLNEAVLNKFENATIGALRFKKSSIGITDLPSTVSELKNNAIAKFMEKYGNSVPADIPQVNLWTKIFETMNAKKGRESSIVFLSNYVLGKKTLFTISPFVDLYNAISLKHGIPMGGYNVANFSGNIELRLARKGEEFFGIGSKQAEKTSANEIVYSDEKGVFCRCWNDKDCDRTKITDNIADILFIFDGIDQQNLIERAIAEICEALLLSEYVTGVANKTNRSIEL
jgi:DNA/RNA-binding domain of Phe-tRNA-synthetase-like protein